MKNTLCCFPIEIKVRGFDARLYQALICMKKNPKFHALIGKKSFVNQNMFQHDMPLLYFAKGMNNYPSSLAMWKKIHDHDGKIIYLDEECGPVHEDPRPFMYRYTEEPLVFANLLCVWGEQQKKVILDHRDASLASKIRVTGHPRFDLRKKEFKSYYAALSKSTKRPDGKFILFNMNFGYASSYFTREEMLDFRFQDMEKRNPGKFKRETVEKLYDYTLEVKDKFITAIKMLSDEFPHITMVIRPHPGEKLSDYEEDFKDCPNVQISKEGSVQAWIIDAELVIHHDCTTAIESFFYGKIPISYDPVVYDDEIDSLIVNKIPLAISHKVKELEELVDTVRKGLTDIDHIDSSNIESKTDALRYAFANIDFDAAHVVADEADKVANGPDIEILPEVLATMDILEQKPVESNKLRSTISQILPSGIKQFYRNMKEDSVSVVSEEEKSMKNRAKTKFPGIELEEVVQRITLFREIDSGIPEVTVTQEMDHVFKLTPVSN